MNIRTYIQNNILLFDGGMGTYLASFQRRGGSNTEDLSLTSPELVRSAHLAYLQAGSRAITCNTFAVNRSLYTEEDAKKLIRASWEIAQSAADGYDAAVFADIGPAPADHEYDAADEYCFLADQFLALGATCFLFETNSTADGLCEAAAYIRSKCPDAFLIASFAVQPDGFTTSGQLASRLIQKVSTSFDAVGFNCISGARHMVELTKRFQTPDLCMSVMPNAGYPTVLGSHTHYNGTPAYFARQLAVLAQMGVRILGGCCGTTPDHIREADSVLKQGFKSIFAKAEKRDSLPAEGKNTTVHGIASVSEKTSDGEGAAADRKVENLFWEKLSAADSEKVHKPIAVELDPPEAASVSRFMKGAKELQEAGADLLTIADCPIARARMDSSILACKVHRELGMEVMPHMTCRDRNLNATKALLLGQWAEGIRNVLVITGDPIPTANRDEIKSVFNFNSRMLAGYITSLGETLLPAPFRVYGALNVNAVNFDVQLKLAQKKEENGICGFFTQPVLTAEAVENLKKARSVLKGRILGGIFPIVSQKNALFMNSEVSGIRIDDAIIAAYEGADRSRGEELAVEISGRIAEEISPYVDGYYIMTPFGRTGLIRKVIERIREE